MAGDLTDCASLARHLEFNASRVRFTFDEIIRKYDRPFPHDDVIDLYHHKIVRDNGAVKFMPIRKIGCISQRKHHGSRAGSTQSVSEEADDAERGADWYMSEPGSQSHQNSLIKRANDVSPLPLVKIESPQQWLEVKRRFRPTCKPISAQEMKQVLEMPNATCVVTFLKQKYCKTEPSSPCREENSNAFLQSAVQSETVNVRPQRRMSGSAIHEVFLKLKQASETKKTFRSAASAHANQQLQIMDERLVHVKDSTQTDHRFSFNSVQSPSAVAPSKRSFEQDFVSSPLKRRRLTTIHAVSTPTKTGLPSPVMFDMDESLSTIAGDNSDLNSTDDCTLDDPNSCSDEEDEVNLISD